MLHLFNLFQFTKWYCMDEYIFIKCSFLDSSWMTPLDFRLTVCCVLGSSTSWELHALHTHTAERSFTPRPLACWDIQPSLPYCVSTPEPLTRSCVCSQSSSDSDPSASGTHWQKTRPSACPHERSGTDHGEKPLIPRDQSLVIIVYKYKLTPNKKTFVKFMTLKRFSKTIYIGNIHFFILYFYPKIIYNLKMNTICSKDV